MFITKQHLIALESVIRKMLTTEMVGMTLAKDCNMPTSESWDRFCRMCDSIETQTLGSPDLDRIWTSMRAAIHTFNRRELTGTISSRGELLRSNLRNTLHLVSDFAARLVETELGLVEQDDLRRFAR